MFRNIINDFVTWYEEPRRRILYVKGALGVGKTWAVKDFATAYFNKQIYVSLSGNNTMREIIENCVSHSSDYDIKDRIKNMDDALYSKYGEISESDTILIFDDAENLPEVEVFFHEYSKVHRHYSICLIASTMQITEYEYHHKDVFNLIRMRPMTFEEFMIAKKATPFLAAIESSKNKPLTSMEENALINMLKEYILVGGIPEIVKAYIKNKDLSQARELQLNYIEKYENLIKKNATPAMAQRMKRIWKSIPKQLLADNKKFMYKYVEENARAREYSEAVYQLCNLGLVRKLPRLKEGALPLEKYVDYKSFELFILDHGLLRAIYNLDMNDNVELEELMLENNYAIAEQYVFQELSSKVGNLYYWTSEATARVPFIYDVDNLIVPVDLRFIDNKKAQNIRTFRSKYSEIDISIKISLSQVYLNDKVLNIPAYGLWNM